LFAPSVHICIQAKELLNEPGDYVVLTYSNGSSYLTFVKFLNANATRSMRNAFDSILHFQDKNGWKFEERGNGRKVTHPYARYKDSQQQRSRKLGSVHLTNPDLSSCISVAFNFSSETTEPAVKSCSPVSQVDHYESHH